MPFLALLPALLLAPHITTPKEQFGSNIGDDYFLANYKQLTGYWTKLGKESDRIKIVSIGKTEEGRDQLVAIISDPANMRQLEHYRDIARRLCLAKGLTDVQAKKLAQEGKAVVWIDGGLHASEVLGAQQLMETVYQLVSRDDEETRRILKDDIVLCVHANPDGMDLCSDWYMRNSDPMKRSLANLPRLYEKYAGHDDNRDFYASNLAETTNMNRLMYLEWFPQIVYNHHQAGPAGTVIFQPPFRDPFNYNFDPLVVAELEMVGANMMSRFIAEGKPGATMRSGSNYSTWWNGGLRTTCYFHNMIGLLTEAIGSPTPMRIPFTPDKLLPKNDLPFPIQPQEWHFRQSVDYSVTANYSVMDIASRHREQFLYNIYQMGRNSIQRGSRDNWTDTPSRIALAREKGYEAMRAPELRDARAYVIPSDQPDYDRAARFAHSLAVTGVELSIADQSFSADGKTYPRGSIVVRCDQAFRPHVLDMFEPQDHPNDLAYPGGPPIPPYDAAGYTLAYQMGVRFDRLLNGPPPIPYRHDKALLMRLRISMLTGEPDVTHIGEFPEHVRGITYSDVATYLKDGKDVFLSSSGLLPASAPRSIRLHPPRVALWDRYGGSMPSGWIRWILERFSTPYTVVFAPQIDAGLAGKFDCLILPSDATVSDRERREIDANTIPEEYRSHLGSMSLAKTVPKLKEFLEQGGTILAIGPATRIAQQLGVNVKNALVDANGDPLPRDKFYIPGSVMRIHLDNTQPIAWGMPSDVDVMVENDPAWIVGDGVEKIGWFDSYHSLRSGWALGQPYLKDTAAIAHAKIGKGHLYLFSPEITFRGQSYGTFKLLFNGILLSAAERAEGR
ncbi:MAG: M14 metallopeptidase family protein [Fimbriimonadales bacterium]